MLAIEIKIFEDTIYRTSVWIALMAPMRIFSQGSRKVLKLYVLFQLHLETDINLSTIVADFKAKLSIKSFIAE